MRYLRCLRDIAFQSKCESRLNCPADSEKTLMLNVSKQHMLFDSKQ